MLSKLRKIILSLLCISMSICILQPLNIYAVEPEDDYETIESYESVEPTILQEDESKREEASKTFILSDKTYQKVLYSIPVHYEEDGVWKEIDNTLTEDEIAMINSDEVSGYSNNQGKLKIKFSKKMHENNLASITVDKYSIKWGFEDLDNQSEAVILKNKETSDERSSVFNNIYQNIIYKNIYDDIDLEYDFDSQSIKENIIIKGKTDINTFTFNYKVDNLVLELNNNGEIEARDSSSDELVFIMPKPYMIDSNNSMSESVNYEIIESKNKQYVIQITADKSWMNDKERQYPIIIDPVIITKQTEGAIDTTFIASWKTTTNYSNKLELLVGMESSEYGFCRTLIKFDLPKLNKGDMIVDAQLNLASYNHSFYSTDTPDLQVNAIMLTSEWEYDTVTWNTRPSYDPLVLDYDYIRRADTVGKANWKNFDITYAVKRWYEDTTNNGLMIRSFSEVYESTQDLIDHGVKGYFWPERYNSIIVLH